MRHEELQVANLTSPAQVEEIRKVICAITGAQFVSADLERRLIEFDLYQDFDNLNLTDVQCRLREHGFAAGELGTDSCTVRFRAP